MINNKTYHVLSVSKMQNESPIAEYFDNFLNTNPKMGNLVFEVHQDSPVRGRIPIPNAKITISKLLGDDYYFSKVITTNGNGETDPLQLPTVSRDLSLKPGESRVSSTYQASVESPGYIRQDIYDVQIFEGITSIQHINLQPSPANQGAQAGPARISMG
ncbi:MAG TPA: hypothetical protein VM577_12035 [Anaerovoracaceae bacterium]|nr:hypothetical protein [Anaerovoracaceae bacterium]